MNFRRVLGVSTSAKIYQTLHFERVPSLPSDRLQPALAVPSAEHPNSVQRLLWRISQC
jgi:hypothetical protein